MKIIGMMILAYVLIILDLGYFRRNDSVSIWWADSGSRMFSHISPIIGFYICKSMYDYFPLTNLFNKRDINDP
jgi:hypothetical protein